MDIGLVRKVGQASSQFSTVIGYIYISSTNLVYYYFGINSQPYKDWAHSYRLQTTDPPSAWFSCTWRGWACLLQWASDPRASGPSEEIEKVYAVPHVNGDAHPIYVDSRHSILCYKLLEAHFTVSGTKMTITNYILAIRGGLTNKNFSNSSRS